MERRYCSCLIVKLFDGVGERNVIAWIAMIDSYVENGFIYEAFNVFRFIQWSKHRPDSATMARMLNIFTELVKMYRRCALGRRAKPVFNAVPG
ncbi:hypothetical protein NC652_031534 [Populus alba x Populus x berolinensis]|nr:hypothetical protein NC652_031534 [Populus alba x Populus x berolinensis]